MTPQDTPNSATDADRKAAEDWASRPEYSQKYKMWLRPSHVEAFLAGAAWKEARLKPVLDAAREALEVYASPSNWYRFTENGRHEFHDGSDDNHGTDHAVDALAQLRAAIGEGEK